MKKNYELYKTFGAHQKVINGESGVFFSVYAPKAKEVFVSGKFNNWNLKSHKMKKNDNIWFLFIPNLKEGDTYKYYIISENGNQFFKSDPFAFFSELRPHTASKVFNPFDSFCWKDEEWLKKARDINPLKKPMSIYEVHLGSWKRGANNSFLNYKEIANLLVPYVKEMGFTHIEIMPLCEHPLDDSWGYQGTGYFSITSRYGDPNDFKYLVNLCHKNNIGVILDWIPGHFCKDSYGLFKFDGYSLFEYDNHILGDNPIWGTANFDLTKSFVRNFLISNANFLFEVFHIDGLRLDAVSNLLYIEYGREKSGLTNMHGGDAKLESISFLQELNTFLFKKYKNPLILAEEATSWPLVTKPKDVGGLCFNFKWNMGWMNDILKYISLSYEDKQRMNNLLTFSLMYAFSENFILPISHDEVVHGKKSLLDKMYGSYSEKFSALKMFYGYMFSHPGKKLLFMGCEFGQFIEWRFYEELEWKLLKYPIHDSIKLFVTHLNNIYRSEKALWEVDFSFEGFNWLNHIHSDNKVITFVRKAKNQNDFLLVICNFSSNLYLNHHIGVSRMVNYKELLNSDRDIYGGENHVNQNIIKPINKSIDNQPFSIAIDIAPLSTIILKPIFEMRRKSL